ncbi:MAG: YmdB family metallophosphoesterase [Ruminococcaceae bacterium]|nr:YmdB family metallophosphoesterase [Oscillospiraceae bacterium]
MKILAIGDIVGTRAIDHLQKTLWKKRDELKIDLVIANGENASDIHGISAAYAQALLDCGVDVITLGNHTWAKRDIGDFLDGNTDKIIRPSNFPGSCPGIGHLIVNVCGYSVLVMNAQGQAFMDTLDSPFDSVELILAREKGNYDLSILDFHAEATSEKYAMGRYFDGRIDIIFGTHTHVPTADMQIFSGGTAYVTDLGMTGPTNGILGTDTNAVLRKMHDHMPSRFFPADGEIQAQAVIFELDGTKPVSVKRITF